MQSTSNTTTTKTDIIFDRKTIKEAVVEIVSDSGEGAQKCGQSLGAISAKMGNGVWTVEIIPAEIQPPARSKAGASGIRVRMGSNKVTNMGDHADIVVALNEQVLYGRIDQNAYKSGTYLLIENKWATHTPETQKAYEESLAQFKELGYIIHEIPMEKECLKHVSDARKGKNMWVLGLLCNIYDRDLEIAANQIKYVFRKKSDKIIQSNLDLLHAGYAWANENLPMHFTIPSRLSDEDFVVMNGNEALSLGVMAADIEVCSMYPITPATSATHAMAETIESAGGIIHQAEDEIAAIGFAIGASYAGKTAVTITSGPGIALKTEFIGLAVMAEIPLVIIDVQRGGPSTGLPTKVEQGDLLAVLYGAAGDAPKIVLAPSTIEECFHYIILARKLADSFRSPVFVLTDANLATGVQPFPRPTIKPDWFTGPANQAPWKKGVKAYDWDAETGLSDRPIPGQKGGMYTLTGLAHDEESHVAYDPSINQRAAESRSRKLAALHKTLKVPVVNGSETGDLLLVGWGSTRGAIEEAVERAREKGANVSSLHLHFLSPIEPGLKGIFSKFKKVMTVEINYSDTIGNPLITEENRRYAQLAWYLRAHTLMDVDCFSNVYGQPLSPIQILKMMEKQLDLTLID
ncbi:2-oxoacid:acceptor oxidoreductase subunit alpha [Fulvivirga lutimaris]|uniref:2-oxoacid:acceptor oxidoreductase subunit alpha n=1 Tax=Fulvivirga lutimaris TaxID=1819566 RepID=UPI0012BD71BB|nr:2-oxoacid:acceptor oxidoreductase subunit alpha [Fulvivirga lutimaris]MTI41663.1 2-oxoacid:acceptor oxidoreductase subunit alpha [Fulvivirga lutimaris]